VRDDRLAAVMMPGGADGQLGSLGSVLRTGSQQHRLARVLGARYEPRAHTSYLAPVDVERAANCAAFGKRRPSGPLSGGALCCCTHASWRRVRRAMSVGFRPLRLSAKRGAPAGAPAGAAPE
jgi:hypothetical protein